MVEIILLVMSSISSEYRSPRPFLRRVSVVTSCCSVDIPVSRAINFTAALFISTGYFCPIRERLAAVISASLSRVLVFPYGVMTYGSGLPMLSSAISSVLSVER